MTYLEAVNSVLRRLREDQADTLLETSYSALIGDFVNDAKKIVEESWNWSSLRSQLEIPTISGTTDYTLTGFKMNAVIKRALNDTANAFISYETKAYFDEWYYNNTPASGTPANYTFIGTDANDDIKIRLYPKPDSIQTLRFDIAAPQEDLSADATQIKAPHYPIIQLAYGMALRERGETGGQSAAEQFAVAQTALADAISIDANRYPEETTYMVV
tara:strand:- start:1772 stop:2419 length:648 start_codon:yes stop_codon:yes gene_type:complete